MAVGLQWFNLHIAWFLDGRTSSCIFYLPIRFCSSLMRTTILPSVDMLPPSGGDPASCGGDLVGCASGASGGGGGTTGVATLTVTYLTVV